MHCGKWSPATGRLGFHRLSPALLLDGGASPAGRRTGMTRGAPDRSRGLPPGSARWALGLDRRRRMG